MGRAIPCHWKKQNQARVFADQFFFQHFLNWKYSTSKLQRWTTRNNTARNVIILTRIEKADWVLQLRVVQAVSECAAWLRGGAQSLWFKASPTALGLQWHFSHRRCRLGGHGVGSRDDPSSPLDVSVPQECSCWSTYLAAKKKSGGDGTTVGSGGKKNYTKQFRLFRKAI